jgi:protein-S-isoprenylcysteine O-methyltransferase Ste14
MSPEWTTIGLWIAWLASWVIAAFWSSRSEKRGGIVGEIFFRGLIYVAVVLLFGVFPTRRYYLQKQLWYFEDSLKWLFAALTACGLLFAWWARIHLGYLWADWAMAKKPEHHVVDTGPYRLVRHPIYSGLIFASFATAIEKGTLAALLGAGILSFALYTRARREERFLRTELLDHTYDAYARKTPMFVPSIGRTRN